MVILPFIIVFLGILTFISYNNSSNELNDAIDERMEVKLNHTLEEIDKKLTTHERNLIATKALVESKEDPLSRNEYKSYFENLLPSNKETFGLGIWYEPFTYNPDEQYVGPYVYKDGDNLLYTEDYEDPSYNYYETDWYIQGAETETPIWTDPYYDKTLDQTFVTTALSFDDQNGDLQGVITSDYVLDSIQALVSNIKIQQTGYAVLVKSDGMFLSHPDEEKILHNNLADELENESMLQQVLESEYGGVTSIVDETEYEVRFVTLPQVGWKLLLFAPTNELYQSLGTLLNQLLVTSGVLIILIVGLVTLIGRTVSKDARQMNTQLEILANGDLTKRINVQSKDEFGQMGNYFNHSVDSLQRMLSSISQNTEHVASTSEELSASAEEITSSVDEVASSIQEVADNADSQSKLSTELVDANEKMQTNMNGMAASVRSMDEQASQSTILASNGNDTVNEVIDNMRQLNKQIKDSAEIIHSLDKKSSQIGSMANLITDVTEQTNLLALNAAIEAARAGESGKGFAVVAEEVRKLAEQSGKASKEINEIITGIQKEVSQSVSMMTTSQKIADNGILSVEKTGESFESIATSIHSLSDKITELTAQMTNSLADMEVMKSKSHEVQQYSVNTSDHAHSVSAVTEEQASMMTEVSKASESLAEMAQQLQEQISKFSI